MRRILGTLLVLCLAAAAAFAGEMKPMTMTGHLIDVACASEHASEKKADFGPRHSKKCLQMAECAESGYALLTADHDVIKFDQASNAKVKQFIAATDRDRDWKIKVTGAMNADKTMKLDSIALQ